MIFIVQILFLQSSGTFKNKKDNVKTALIISPNKVTYFRLKYGINKSVMEYATASAEAIIAIFT